MDIIIIGLSVLFFLGHGLSWFFTKTKIPDLLILIVLGIVLGPQVTGLIDPQTHLGQAGSVLATVTLIIILYEGGIHLSFKDLMESSVSALSLSVLSFFSITFVTTAVLLPVLPFLSALLVGVGIGSTSSAIVMPMVKYLSIGDRTKTVLSLESAFTDVLTIVIFLGLLEYLTSQATGGGGSGFLLSLSSTPVVSVGVGVGSGLLWSVFRKQTDASRLPFAGEAVALLTYGVLEFLNLNGAIGVLALGFTLANINLLPVAVRGPFAQNPITDSEVSLLSAVTFLLRTMFFLYLGLLIQVEGVSSLLWAGLLSVLIFVTRYLSVRLVFKGDHVSRLDALTATVMGPRGLACAVLATLPVSRGLAQGEWMQNLIFAIIPLSILITSVFVALSEKQWFKTKVERFFKSYPSQEGGLSHLPSPAAVVGDEDKSHNTF